jgi:hypothetical protein
MRSLQRLLNLRSAIFRFRIRIPFRRVVDVVKTKQAFDFFPHGQFDVPLGGIHCRFWRRLVDGACAWLKIALDAADEIVFIEENGCFFLLPVFAAGLEGIEIIPAFLVEGVNQHGRTQDVQHLAFGHPWTELVDHVLIDDIALLDVDMINAWQVVQDVGARDQQGAAQNYTQVKRASHGLAK